MATEINAMANLDCSQAAVTQELKANPHLMASCSLYLSEAGLSGSSTAALCEH